MRLGVFLALVATGLALECNVGNLILEKGVITLKATETQMCAGRCSRSVMTTGDRSVVFLACEENEMALFMADKTLKPECTATELVDQCLCSENKCSDWKAEEKLHKPQVLRVDTTPICYVGYYANNGTNGPAGILVNSGATVMCSQGQACSKISGSIGNTAIEAYMCTTQAACNAAIGTTDGSGTITGDNVQMACCTDPDCSALAKANKDISVPTTITTGNRTVQCLQGIQLNYKPFGQFLSLPCSGSCSSVSIKTYLGSGKNRQVALLDMFTCDPVAVCSQVNLKNSCGNIVVNNTNSLLRGCCCDSDKCIDPTSQPPVYPQKTLKCYTGILAPGYNVGAEMVCPGKCGRLTVPIGNTTVKYHMCAPYSFCQGLGIGDGDQSINPPMEEETSMLCCSSKDNCNIDDYDLSVIKPDPSIVPTTNYPILCYGGVHLNGVPMTTGSYGMCNGECASATFVTTVFGQSHNTTIYTCDPVTMCKQAGISNGCSQVLPGVNACCCDSDTCLDPTRTYRGKMTCYTGVYIKEDNFLAGGEMLCDGWCASLSTTVNNKNSTTYWCAPVRTCRQFALGMGGDNNCNTITGTSNTLSGCCCSENDNCNVPTALLPNVTAIKPRNEPPIVCYEAIHINGQPSGGAGYRICDGECVSMTMGDKLSNGSVVTTTLYTCDSASACNALGLRNSCGSTDGTVYSCCCDSDACIDPTVNRSPDKKLTCYVGVQSQLVSAGAEVNCDGYCANMTTMVGGVSFASYHCMPRPICRALGLDNSCNTLLLDRAISGCCCDSSSNCNAMGTNLNTSIPVSPPETPIACYSGININGTWSGGNKWQACQGDCMSVSINTTLNGNTVGATLYTCDPTTVCTALQMNNRCHQLEPGVSGCCCSDSGCIDPTKNPPKQPHYRPLTCWVGMISSYNNLSVGAESECFGSCASLTSVVGGANFTAFVCAPKTVCSQLGLYDTCQTIQADRAITGCCCDNADNCNAVGFNVPANRTAHDPHEFPIVCYQGLFVNGRGVSLAGWTACTGDCALVSFNTTYNNQRYQADYYTCDPSTVCHQLGLINNCSTVEPGVSGCCCDTDACLDPTRQPPKKPGPPLVCYVGLKTAAGIDVGSEVVCNGMCGNIHGIVGGVNVSSYLCAPTPICKSLELNNQMRRLPGDRFLTAMCCDTGKNCNVMGDPTINTNKPVSPPEYPITCYSGIFVNKQLITPGSWQTCNGDCASLSLTSTLNNGTSIVAEIYSCDPTSVCKGLGVYNNCSTIEQGLDGCCCTSNGCLDPTKNPPKKPGNPLQCYVGFTSTYNNLSVGATVDCAGKCASLSGIVANQSVVSYSCVDSAICRTLNLDDTCAGLPGDREVLACCCDNFNNCNIRDPSIKPPPKNPNTEFPISCWNGIYLNGKALTTARWGVCNGDCASVTMNTTYNGMQHSATIYTCDPTSVCTALKSRNRCTTIEPGVEACCCDSDGCINPMKGKSPKYPLTCYVGVQSDYNSLSVGATVYCNGRCASLSGILAGFKTTTYHCVDNTICKSLELDNACASLPGDREVSACCCDNAQNCNINGTSISAPPVKPPTDPVIACYTGVWLNGRPITAAAYQACQGDCASVTLNTTLNSVQHSATLYTCDPSTVCRALNMTNGCASPEPGLTGCCCDSDGCVSPSKTPGNQLVCYVGVYAAYNNYSVGVDQPCNGKCFSISTNVNGNLVKAYQCVDPSICSGSGLGLDNKCGNPPNDVDVTACCCDYENNCNSKHDSVNQNPLVVNATGMTPIACWSGLYLNGNALTKPKWNSCVGDCAAIQYNTSLAGTAHSLTLYGCDPVTVCQQLGIINRCATIDRLPGITGCCCSGDACMDGKSIIPKTQSINCFAGIISEYNNLTVLAPVKCNGRCSSLSGIVAGYKVTAYQCIDTNTCQLLGADGMCNTIPGDRDITGCCCGDSDFCNNKSLPPPPVPSYNEAPIACFSGLYVNGLPLAGGAATYSACRGQCASITLNTTLNNNYHIATLYTCDPSSVCSQLNITNNCASPEPGIQACCCDSDACIDPTANRIPGNPLTCYVGVYANNGYNAGADTICDGKCASLETVVNNVFVKTYHCLSKQQAESFHVDNGCKTVFTDREIKGCVCDNKNNCNVKNEPVLQNPIYNNYTGIPIACWTGLYVNGNSVGATGWNGCQGQCAAIQLNTTNTGSGTNHSLTIYTCDPASVCSQMQLSNSCGNVDYLQGVTACCCDSDACMDGTSIVPKKGTVECYVGVVSNYNGGFSAGSRMTCAGSCSSLTGTVSGFNVTTYQCVDRSVCTTLGADNSCNSNTYLDRDISGCCCRDSDFCNIKGTGITPPKPRNYTEPAIACYTGLYINGKSAASGRYIACNGQCASMTLNTTTNGVSNTATVYMCDPSSVCAQLNLTNTCANPEPGLQGCCCDTDTCIDPAKNRYPGRGLKCYVGGWYQKNNYSAGADTICNGRCASLETLYNNARVKLYQCISTSQAKSIGIDNNCKKFWTDRDVTACVCDNADNCNVQGEPVLQNPITSNFTGNPIACWNGLYVNGNLVGEEGFNACNGECAVVQLNTTVANMSHSLSLYTCDPAAACSALGLNNNCGSFDGLQGITTCCCDSDGCLDKKSIVPKSGTTECFVGLVSDFNGGFSATGRVTCKGQCSSISGKVGGYNVAAYQCVDRSVCTALGADNSCNSPASDPSILGCCCSDSDFCNIKGTGITPPKKPSASEPTISCYTGLWIGGQLMSKSNYVACQGLCSSISLTTAYQGNQTTATIYMCDPSSICSQLNVTNTCNSPEPSVNACCCDSDVCIDPTKNRSPGNILSCYVGVYAAANDYSVGAYTPCDGKCASLETVVNNSTVKSYHCISKQQAEGFHIDNGCKPLPTDREIKACVCDNSNNCNSKNDPVVQNTNPLNASYTGTPIACWNGLYVNGKPQTTPNWNGCKGSCAVIQFNTTIAQTTHSATLYTCDPSAVCDALKINNQCVNVDQVPGLTGCCCNTDACVTEGSIIPKIVKPQGGSASGISTLVAVFFAAVYMLSRQ